MLVFFFDRKDVNDVLFGVGFVALAHMSVTISALYPRRHAHLQTLVAFKLLDSLLRKYMSTRHQIHRLHTWAQRLRGDRADPALAALAGRISTAGRVLSELGIDFELYLDHISERLHSPAQDLFAIGLGADALDIVAGEQELEYSVLVVKIPD